MPMKVVVPSADTRRTAKLTRRIVAHLRKLRCASFCRL